MTPPPSATPRRGTTEERRSDVLAAAIEEFALHGLHGSSTARIAEDVGISQPYVFKLFGTKKELFIATVELVCDRIEEAFRVGAAKRPDEALASMGEAYEALLAKRSELLVLLHGFAAAADDEVRDSVRSRYRRIVRLVRESSDAKEGEIRAFFGQGMLLTVAMAVELDEFLPRGQEHGRPR